MFYLRRKAYDSAIIYFKDVIANYPNGQRAPDALLRLVDSYRAIGYTQEVQETCEHLRRFYPTATELGEKPAVQPIGRLAEAGDPDPVRPVDRCKADGALRAADHGVVGQIRP